MSKCNPHPKAPHGFNRNASHAADRYVCDCESWDAYSAGYQAGCEAMLRLQEVEETSGSPTAPDLLEALKRIEAMCAAPPNFSDATMQEIARDAIAKATGNAE